jgi:hypothetical protein
VIKNVEYLGKFEEDLAVMRFVSIIDRKMQKNLKTNYEISCSVPLSNRFLLVNNSEGTDIF